MKIVASVEVGGNSEVSLQQLDLSEKHTVKVTFKDFASLPHQVGNRTFSPAFPCHGKEWRVGVFPGSSDKEDAGHVGLYLLLVGEDRNVQAKYTMWIPSANASVTSVYDFKGTPAEYGYGWSRVCKNALSSLGQDGALVVYISIQIFTVEAPTRAEQARQQELRARQERLLAGQEELRAGQQELRAGQERLEQQLEAAAAPTAPCPRPRRAGAKYN